MYFLSRLIPPRPELQANDPAIRARIGLSYEAYEMLRLMYKK